MPTNHLLVGGHLPLGKCLFTSSLFNKMVGIIFIELWEHFMYILNISTLSDCVVQIFSVGYRFPLALVSFAKPNLFKFM